EWPGGHGIGGERLVVRLKRDIDQAVERRQSRDLSAFRRTHAECERHSVPGGDELPVALDLAGVQPVHRADALKRIPLEFGLALEKGPGGSGLLITTPVK